MDAYHMFVPMKLYGASFFMSLVPRVVMYGVVPASLRVHDVISNIAAIAAYKILLVIFCFFFPCEDSDLC